MQNNKKTRHWSPLTKTAFVLAIVVFVSYFYRGDTLFARNEKDTLANINTVSVSVSEERLNTISSDTDVIVIPEASDQAKKEDSVTASEKKIPRYQVYDETLEEWVLMPDIKWEEYLRDKCKDADIEKYIPILMLQLYHESKFTPDVISSTRDHGLAQINECNHARLRKELGITNFLDPYQSIDCQVYMMADTIKEHNIYYALSLYNTGKLIEHTKYSDDIMRQYEMDYCVLTSNY